MTRRVFLVLPLLVLPVLALAACGLLPPKPQAPTPAPYIAPEPEPALSDGNQPCGRAGDRKAKVGDIEITYRQSGPPNGEPMLLIGGADHQLVDWRQHMLDALMEKGFRLTYFDGRDTGCSTHMTAAGAPDFAKINAALSARKTPQLAYTQETLADDAAGLMDALGIKRAHVIGVSGGAVVAEMLAGDRPDSIASLTLVMANSGNPAWPTPADPVQLVGLPDPPPEGAPREAILAWRIANARVLESEDYRRSDETTRAMAALSIDRSYDPDAIHRNAAAELVTPDLRPRLKLITAPTVVIQGDADPIIPVQLARDVARTIPGAKFVTIDGMAHDIPDVMIGEVVKAVMSVARPEAAKP